MTTTIHARRPGLKAWLRLIQAEARMVVRDTAGLIIPLGLPLLILVMQAISIDETATEVAPGATVLDVYVLPVVLTMVVATVAVINMPSFLATYRKTKMLRRLAVTPASPAMVLVAQFVVSLIQVVIGIGVAIAVGILFFEANLPAHLLTGLLVLAGCCAAMYAVGMIVASVAPTPNSSVALGLVAFFAMAALGGMFGGMQNLPATLAEVGVWLPFGASVEAFQAVWLGEAVQWQNWVSMGVTTLVGGTVAAALFRWE